MNNKNELSCLLPKSILHGQTNLKVEDIPKSVIDKLNIIVMDSIGLMVSAKNEALYLKFS